MGVFVEKYDVRNRMTLFLKIYPKNALEYPLIVSVILKH